VVIGEDTDQGAEQGATRSVRRAVREVWRNHPRLSVTGIIVVPLAIAGVVVLLTTATSASASGAKGGAAAAAATTTKAVPAAVVSTSVASGATGVDTQTPVTVNAAHGKIESVTLTSTSGTVVPGTLSSTGASWSSDGHLAIETSYTLRATAVNAAGKATTSSESFTTLTPTKILRIQSAQPASGETVGVGEPVIVEFETYVPASYRAAVEKAMTVTTSSHVPGAWSWISETRVDWRPQAYWKTGTTVSVNINLDGVKAGATQYGDKNLTYNFTIGSDVESVVDLANHTFKVYENGQLIHTWPTSGGRPSLATWQGTFVALGKYSSVRMSSCGAGLTCDPSNPAYYNELEYNAVQFTDSGSYVHAASWDGQLGITNTSHGCIHLSDTNAKTFYDLSKTGDIIQVINTGAPVVQGNGITDWNESWATWLASSATGVQNS
jgi:lipoprotein-anchoring transpeptidase ErfK/SrfK